jgi:regulator of sigma E protease
VRVRDSVGLDQDRPIPGERLAELPEDPSAFSRLGLTPRRPELPAVIGELTPGGPAALSGFALGDRVLTADGQPIRHWPDWVTAVRERPGQTLRVEVEREGRILQLQVTPRALDLEGVQVGRIGAGVASPDELPAEYRVEVRYGPVASLWEALTKSLDMSLLMVRVMGKMLIGQASVENLSGPITIAETAGRTADYGLGAFVKFLAAVSISLAVLNLLPIPVLDGGHLLYYLIEWIKGSPLSEQAQMQGQRVGIVLLAALMGLAFYVDLSRIFG